MTNIFEYATRNKVRFPSSQGALTVEQLWELPLQARGDKPSLDQVARNIYMLIKDRTEVSFVDTKSVVAQSEDVSLEVVKHIIKVRQDEAEAKEQAKARESKRAKLKELIERKNEEELGSKTKEELQAELDALS